MFVDLDYEFDNGEFFLEGTSYMVPVKKLTAANPDQLSSDADEGQMKVFLVSTDNEESYDLVIAYNERSAVSSWARWSVNREWVYNSAVDTPNVRERANYHKLFDSHYVHKGTMTVSEYPISCVSFVGELVDGDRVDSDVFCSKSFLEWSIIKPEDIRIVSVATRGKRISIPLLPDGVRADGMAGGDYARYRPLKSSHMNQRQSSLMKVLGIYANDIDQFVADGEGTTTMVPVVMMGAAGSTYPHPQSPYALVMVLSAGSKVTLELLPVNELVHYEDKNFVLWFLNNEDSVEAITSVAWHLPLSLPVVEALTGIDGKLVSLPKTASTDLIKNKAKTIAATRKKVKMPWTPPGVAASSNTKVDSSKAAKRQRAFVDMVSFSSNQNTKNSDESKG